MADLEHITAEGETYDIADATARTDISALQTENAELKEKIAEMEEEISELNSDLIQSGTVNINSEAANIPASVSVTFPTEFSSTPIVLVTGVGSSPGYNLLGASVQNVTRTGCDIYATRNNTSNTNVYWLAYGKR